MPTVWTLTLGTSFDLKSGGASVANFTTSKATLPGEVETKGNITVKDSGNSAKVTISSTDGKITSGAIDTTGNITVKSGSQDKVTLSTAGKITSGDISSGAITASGAIKGDGFEGTSLDVKTGKVTCGEVDASGSVSSASGFYVQ